MTRLNSSLSVLAALVWAASTAAAAEVRYSLRQIEIVPPSAQELFVNDLNDKGAVVGGNDAANPDTRHAFRWRRGAYTDLNDAINPTALNSEASGNNNHGDVVGIYFGEDERFHGFLLHKGVAIPVTTGHGDVDIYPEDINNRRQVAGVTFDFGRSRGFVWKRGEFTILPALAEDDSVTVQQINDRGVVVGWNDITANFRVHAVIWKHGEVIDLGVPPGWFDSRGKDINNRGQVVGQLVGANTVGGFLWEDGVMSVLPPLAGGSFSSPLSINDAGEIVGQSEFVQAGISVATLWDDHGQAMDLNELIRSNDPLRPFVRLLAALLINDRGQIVATGFDSRTSRLARYLLTPRH
jgi:probable HAF family extracellular repeat protein